MATDFSEYAGQAVAIVLAGTACAFGTKTNYYPGTSYILAMVSGLRTVFQICS